MDSVGNNRGVHGVGDHGSLGSVKSVGGIGHHGGVGSEGLALGGAPVLPLVGLAHALVADLAVAVSVDWLVGAIVDRGDGCAVRGGEHGRVHGGVVSHTVVQQLGGGVARSGQGETHKSLQQKEIVIKRVSITAVF